MIDLTKVELREGNIPKEVGYYICRYKNTDAIVLITCHETDKVLVILQCGEIRAFSLDDTDKEFLWSDKLELLNKFSPNN